ncbi:DUF3616 domain-containing protein [Luteolibacter soli]|uniref:DUF3616 domain-containing protein n=1 Tax=Luteolibacter soli TaxID=3135280 RepID=A0ABU9B017_9BACT
MKANRSARSYLPLALAAVVLTALPAAWARDDAGAQRLEILPQEWQLAGFENSLDLSGIAAATKTQCLVGSDEMFYIQPGVIDAANQRIDSKRPIALPLASTGKKQEIDIEGVAYSSDDHAYYVVGSHGLGKKKGDFQPDRHSIYQVPVDPVTGQVKKEGIRRTSLLPWLEKTPEVKASLKQPLQQNGFNIEGLTWSGGKLWIGLRAPNQDGKGLVLELSPGQLFGGGKPSAMTIHEVSIGKGRGFREIAAVRDGFILLTGNASSEASKKIPISAAPGPDTRFELLYWNGSDTTATNLGRLPQNGGKGEALLVLEDVADHIDLLVIFDGLPGGEPVAVRIHR